MDYSTELETAVESVLKACELCIQVQYDLVSEHTLTKKDKSPVTVADFGSQALICRDLTHAFPDDPIVAEEDPAELHTPSRTAIKENIINYVNEIDAGVTEAEILDAIARGGYEGGSRGRFWTLDPIDGTKGFLRGEQYAIALALVEDGEVVLGVLGCPNLPLSLSEPEGLKGVLLYAVKDRGSHIRLLEETHISPVRVTGIDSTRDASFCESVESSHSSHDDASKIAETLGVTRPPIRIDSQCKYAAIARGDASIYLRLPTRKDYEEKIWDHAAGSIIVEEAGGKVTDIYGKPLKFSLGRTLKSNKGVVGSNGLLHDDIINAVNSVVA